MYIGKDVLGESFSQSDPKPASAAGVLFMSRRLMQRATISNFEAFLSI